MTSEVPGSQKTRRVSPKDANTTSDKSQKGVGGADVPNKNSNYAYVNRAYAGNMDNYSDLSTVRVDPPTSVVREQYWTCSRWPRVQRVLAISVAVLIGAVIGLVITVSTRDWPKPTDNLFSSRTIAD